MSVPVLADQDLSEKPNVIPVTGRNAASPSMVTSCSRHRKIKNSLTSPPDMVAAIFRQVKAEFAVQFATAVELSDFTSFLSTRWPSDRRAEWEEVMKMANGEGPVGSSGTPDSGGKLERSAQWCRQAARAWWPKVRVVLAAAEAGAALAQHDALALSARAIVAVGDVIYQRRS